MVIGHSFVGLVVSSIELLVMSDWGFCNILRYFENNSVGSMTPINCILLSGYIGTSNNVR